MYTPRRVSRSLCLAVRGLRHHLRRWGPETGKPLILLHGGRDASATFQFMVDCFERDWRIVAPDWRGHGKTERAPQGYWFPDYLADLDAILEALFPGEPVPLVGHSLGGNAACIYAGLRPERVSRLISLDGFGLPDLGPQAAPAQLQRWLAGWREPLPPHKTYAAVADMAARLRQANPRLDEAKSLFLASELSERLPDGRYTWDFDPRHRAPFATLHRARRMGRMPRPGARAYAVHRLGPALPASASGRARGAGGAGGGDPRRAVRAHRGRRPQSAPRRTRSCSPARGGLPHRGLSPPPGSLARAVF